MATTNKTKKVDYSELSSRERLNLIRKEIKATKEQYNNFGKFKYRSAEDILEVLKPLLWKYGGFFQIKRDVVLRGERYYLETTAIYDDIESSAYARESEEKAGMDSSQITGSSSSYSLKYALEGLLLLDNNKDADTDENTEERRKSEKKEQEINAKMKKNLLEMCKVSNTDIKTILDYYKAKKVGDLSPEQWQKAIMRLQGKVEKMEEMNVKAKEQEPEF